MHYSKLIIGFLIIFFFACNKNAQVDDCLEEQFSEYVILEDDERFETCIYYEVFRYNGDITYVAHCCVCDLVYILYKCDGTPLCEHDQACFDAHASEAEYLYSIVLPQ